MNSVFCILFIYSFVSIMCRLCVCVKYMGPICAPTNMNWIQFLLFFSHEPKKKKEHTAEEVEAAKENVSGEQQSTKKSERKRWKKRDRGVQRTRRTGAFLVCQRSSSSERAKRDGMPRQCAGALH